MDPRHHPLSLALALAVTAIFASPLAHSAYRHLERPELCAAADLVVYAEATSAESFWAEGDRGAIHTRTWFAALQPLKGSPSSSHNVELVHAGGEIDGLRMDTGDMKPFAEDAAYLLFLMAAPDGSYRLVAGPQASVRISRFAGEQGEEWSDALRSMGGCGR